MKPEEVPKMTCYETPYGERYEIELKGTEKISNAQEEKGSMNENNTSNVGNVSSRNNKQNTNTEASQLQSSELSKGEIINLPESEIRKIPKLVIHLKDKDKIRNKKRWSQVCTTF